MSPYELTPNDLPAGFVRVPPDLMKEWVQNWPENSSAFMLLDAKHSQIVVGALIPFQTRAEQLSFDAALPYFVQIAAAGTGATDFKKFDGLDDIGEARSALTTGTRMSNVQYRLDAVGFRRGQVGALVVIMYPDGDKPAAPVGDLARLMEKRISQFQNPQNTTLYRS